MQADADGKEVGGDPAAAVTGAAAGGSGRLATIAEGQGAVTVGDEDLLGLLPPADAAAAADGQQHGDGCDGDGRSIPASEVRGGRMRVASGDSAVRILPKVQLSGAGFLSLWYCTVGSQTVVAAGCLCLPAPFNVYRSAQCVPYQVLSTATCCPCLHFLGFAGGAQQPRAGAAGAPAQTSTQHNSTLTAQPGR